MTLVGVPGLPERASLVGVEQEWTERPLLPRYPLARPLGVVGARVGAMPEAPEFK